MLIGYVQEKVWISSGLGQDCDRIWAEHPAHTSRFGGQRLSCYVGELAATIGEGSTYLLWLKLFIWPNSILKSVLAFQKVLFHPLNVNKGLDMTMVAPLFSTRYPRHTTANPGSYDCHQVSTLCRRQIRTCGGRRWPERWFRIDAWSHHFSLGHCVEPLRFGSVWWFAQTFLGEIKWARVLQDTQHHVRFWLWPPASASWTSEVRDMPAWMQRRRKTVINMYQHFSGTTPNDVLLDVYTEVLDVNTGDVLSVFTPSFVHRWRAISGILARPAVHFKQPGYHIAVHVGRGDVLVNRFGSKFANDDIFNQRRTHRPGDVTEGACAHFQHYIRSHFKR